MICEKTQQTQKDLPSNPHHAEKYIFEFYSEHEFGKQPKRLASVLDNHPEILTIIEKDLVDKSLKPVGRSGLTVENVFRCLLLKQQLGLSYEELAFHLSDSMSYRTFVRLPNHVSPKRSCPQSTIRRIRPETLEEVHNLLTVDCLGVISVNRVVVECDRSALPMVADPHFLPIRRHRG